MHYSKYNIFSKMRNSNRYFLVNPLWGSADILDEHAAREFQSGNSDNKEELIRKGYWVEGEEEEKLFRRKYLEFLDRRESDEIQLFFVPGYSCNFDCAYCYQKDYAPGHPDFSPSVIDAFFSYIDREFAGRAKYITLFGGEPLLPGRNNREALEYFLARTSNRNLDLAIVTNGFHLAEFLPLFEKSSIREIQVTLDGTDSVHNGRRMLRGGGPTFERIVEGIDSALEKGYPINLRMVVDRDNIESLPTLAKFAVAKGWTGNPKFKTQLGRNYELHFCQDYKSRLFNRIELYEKVYELIQKDSAILEFHRPAFSIARFLFENGELPDPLFDSCPGCKTEWAFDSSGKIYPCTAFVGKEGEELGTFFPGIAKNEDKIRSWQDRDVLRIPQCKTCSVSLLCGGGCAAVARNKTGSLHEPDCRPVRELLELGLSLYFDKEMADERTCA